MRPARHTTGGVGDELPWLHPLRLKTIKKDSVRREAEIAEKEQKRLEAEEAAPYRTRRLGKYVYGPGREGGSAIMF